MGRYASKHKNFLPDGVNFISYYDDAPLIDDAHPTIRLDAFLPGSSPPTLRVYLDISTTNEGHQPDVWYHKYRSILSRFDYEGFQEYSRLGIDLREIGKKLRWIDKRLERNYVSGSERENLLKEREKLAKLSQKLLREFSKSLNLYADRFFVDVPEDYGILVKKLGYSSDTFLHLFFNKGTLEVHFADASSEKLSLAYISKVYAGKYHPAKGIFKGSQEAKRVLKDFIVLSELLSGKLLSYRKGSFTTHNLIPVRHMVFTAPKGLSYALWQMIKSELEIQGDPDQIIAIFRDVTAKTLKDFLTYLASKEKVEGKLLFGFTINVHLVGDKNPFEPHFHSDCVVLFVVYDKKSRNWYRLNPILNEDDLTKLRELWKANLIEVFWELLSEDTRAKEFNVWAGDNYYSLPLNLSQVFFEIKYASRKLFVNYANHFEKYGGGDMDKIDMDFVKFVFDYENRTVRYGFLTNVKRYLKESLSDTVDERIKELEWMINTIKLELDNPDLPETLRENLLNRLFELESELDELKAKRFDHILKKAYKNADELLSNDNLTLQRIIDFLEVFYKAQGKLLTSYEFHPELNDVPLYQLIDALNEDNPRVLVWSDRHKTLDLIWLRGDVDEVPR